MGESETVVTQTSVIMGFTSASYSSTDHGDASGNAVPDSWASATGSSGDLAAPMATVDLAAPPDTVDLAAPMSTGNLAASTGTADAANAMPRNSNIGSGNVCNTDLDSAIQEAPTTATHDTSENLANLVNASVDSSSEVAAYDSCVNGNDVREGRNIASPENNENGITSDDVHGSTSVHQLVDGSALSAEEDRLWSIVRANYLDFNAWTALIEETEKMTENNVLKIRKVYDAFLAEFPLCYGYWKKYADHETRLGSVDKVMEVYERAVQGVTYSVEMWLHYCVFSISTYADPDTIRRIFEQGLAYVGTDYLSFPLWDKYIEYEYMLQEWSRLGMIYTRILDNPNQQLDRYFTSFRELVASRPLSELRTAEEAAAATDGANLEAVGQEIEGEVHPYSVEQSHELVSEGLTEADELENYIAIREEMYKKAKELDSKIIGFETAIRRPYFHVRPLNAAELENWHYYLDFIEGGDDFSKVVKLFERCLIACANYPEYWIRYVLCMETNGSMDLADNALARATQVFVKRQPEIHLFAARFREHHGDILGARAAYQLMHTEISPGLLEAIIKHANMEHRLGNLEDACSIYEQAIAIEKGEDSQNLPLLFAQYSRFLSLICGKVEKAREILDQMVEKNQLSKSLLEAIIHLESIQSLPKRIDYLDSLVDKFIVPNRDNPKAASISEREEISSIFLEFLDLFGDAQLIKKADHRHAKLFLSKKRHAEDFLVSDRTRLARSGVLSPTPSVMGAYPSAQNQWAAGYGVQPQAWPQVTQAQGQQWNPGYAQQAAYGTYSNQGSGYVQPQPQTAAYGAYPPTYPVQAFPQQGYAQPSTASTSTPLQQPTSVPPQAYYGSYY